MTKPVSVAELIEQKETIRQKKKSLYELESSVGTIICKVPTSKLIADAWQLRNSAESNAFLIYECTVTPSLKDKSLLDAYEIHGDPYDIVAAIFQAGEVSRIADSLLKLAGFNGTDVVAKLHDEIKN